MPKINLNADTRFIPDDIVAGGYPIDMPFVFLNEEEPGAEPEVVAFLRDAEGDLFKVVFEVDRTHLRLDPGAMDYLTLSVDDFVFLAELLQDASLIWAALDACRDDEGEWLDYTPLLNKTADDLKPGT